MTRLYQTAGGMHREGSTGPSGFAKVVVRQAERFRRDELGAASRGDLRFNAARIIDGSYTKPFNGVW